MIRFLILFLFSSTFIFLSAQVVDNGSDLDILYLKNGKIVKGIITKQEFGTVSVKLPDQNVRIYQQIEIKKIEKVQRPIPSNNDSIRIYSEKSGIGQPAAKDSENRQAIDPASVQNPIVADYDQTSVTLIATPNMNSPLPTPDTSQQVAMIDGSKTGNPDDYFDPFSIPRPRRIPKIWNREIRGFRVFVDYAYIQGIGKDKNHRLEWGASIGFQFNPIFYLGMGTLYDITLNSKDASLPVFLNPRINFLDENTTPFWDVKVGYSVAEGKGFYCSTSFGVSFARPGRGAFNIGLVYSLQNAKYYDWSKTEPKEWVSFKPYYHGIALKVTYEFGIGR